jgi:hypothetical protein
MFPLRFTGARDALKWSWNCASMGKGEGSATTGVSGASIACIDVYGIPLSDVVVQLPRVFPNAQDLGLNAELARRVPLQLVAPVRQASWIPA